MPQDRVSSREPAQLSARVRGAGGRLTRRHVVAALALGSTAALAPALLGCTVSDPVISGPTDTPSQAPDPTPDPEVVAAAGAEVATQELAANIAAAARNGTWEVPDSFAPWCQAVADMHQTHATVLRQRDPLGGAGAQESVWISVSPRPSVALPSDLQDTLSVLKDAETSLASQQAGRADTADDPAMAMVFLSAAIAAQGHRSSGVVAPVPAQVAPVSFEAGTPDQARQILLSHLDAAIFGFETGLGQMPFADARRAPGLERLDQVRAERDAVAAEIVAASQTPPPARAGYELPGVVGTPDEIAALWGNLELGTLQSRARLAVSLPSRSRGDAISATLTQVDQVTRWRVALSYWPGWV